MDEEIINHSTGSAHSVRQEPSVCVVRALRVPASRVLRRFAALTLATATATFMYPATGWPSQSSDAKEERSVIVIQDYRDELSRVRAANPNVKLRVARDPDLADEPVLLVEYPAPTGNPAERDVWCLAENQDWSGGRAISFQIKPAHALRISVSFMDRNRVAYTTWKELEAGMWQDVRISFDEIRPNPYFQPPDAKKDAPIDVSDVKAIGFAPQDGTAGELAVAKFVVVE